MGCGTCSILYFGYILLLLLFWGVAIMGGDFPFHISIDNKVKGLAYRPFHLREQVMQLL